jgi:ubiquinone/menaquinone biosynthesis C-methylase UbiE
LDERFADMNAKNEYDKWHRDQGENDSCTSPWHNLVLGHAVPDRDFCVQRLLEIGCGRGGFACWLGENEKRPCEILAADFSEEAIKIGKKQAEEKKINGIIWLQADMQDIPIQNDSVDTVVSFETIEHVPDPVKALHEVYRILKPGGKLFLTTPNYFGSTGLYRVYVDIFKGGFSECGQPINNWTFIFRTKKWLKRAGFQIELVDGVGHYLFWPKKIPKKIPLLDNFRMITKWTGFHSFFMCRKI